jgi:hypothetical protein
LELSTATITQLLKPFKAALPSLVANLAEHPELKPYITIPPRQKSGTKDESSDESSAEEDEDGSLLLSNPISKCKPAPYPLTDSQYAVIKRCRRVDTLIFPGLPSFDSILKVIAISTHICIPFCDQVILPNVEKVIFSSQMQEKLFEWRHMAAIAPPRSPDAQMYSLPHPVTFALDWLANDFSLCIHSPTSFFRRTWIAAQIQKREITSSQTEEGLKEQYRQQYDTLNPVGGTVSVTQLPRMTSLSYHDLLPGARPQYPPGIEIHLHFRRHDDPDIESVRDTLQAIAEPLTSIGAEKTRLTLIDVEYLEHPGSKKLGPKALSERKDRRVITAKKVVMYMIQIAEEKKGGRLRGSEKKASDDAVELKYATTDWNYDLACAVCAVCGNDCKEISCNEEICD